MRLVHYISLGGNSGRDYHKDRAYKESEVGLRMKGQYTKLFIIGNGFDRWQGLPTSYDNFKQYYFDHILEITKELGIKTSTDKAGDTITPVEMIFGDIFKPEALPGEFFWNFESSMALLDDQNIALFFGKTDEGVYQMQETLHAALEILQKAFGDWIKSIEIDEKDAGYCFGDSCYFINFNYTNTLEKRFAVEEKNVNYIHGDFSDTESIIFGHSKHPETAFPELMEQKLVHRIGGGKSKRLRGLYLVEDALYETDKHVQDNIDDLCEFMTLDGVHIEDITDIYVLGHSFGDPDYEYFEFLVKATQMGIDFNKLSALWQVRNIGMDIMTEEDLLEWIQLNIIYATQHRQMEFQKENISFPKEELLEKRLFGKTNVYTDGDGNVHEVEEALLKAQEAVHKRFVMEQAARTKEVIEELCMLKNVKQLPDNCYSVLGAADYIDGGHDKRVRNAKWHISYFSDKDKEQIEKVMKKANCKNYELYQGIDACIDCFRKY